MRCMTGGTKEFPRFTIPCREVGSMSPCTSAASLGLHKHHVPGYSVHSLDLTGTHQGGALCTVSHCAERSEAARTIRGFRSLWLINDWPWSSKQ